MQQHSTEKKQRQDTRNKKNDSLFRDMLETPSGSVLVCRENASQLFSDLFCCVKFSGNLFCVISSGLGALTVTVGHFDLDVFLAVGGDAAKTSFILGSTLISCLLTAPVRVKTRGSVVLTFTQRDKGDVVGENALGNRWTGSDAGIVATVGGVHLGDIEVSRYLGDKAPFVQRDKGGEFVEDPAERQLGWGWRKKETRQNANQATGHVTKASHAVGEGVGGVKMAHCAI